MFKLLPLTPKFYSNSLIVDWNLISNFTQCNLKSLLRIIKPKKNKVSQIICTYEQKAAWVTGETKAQKIGMEIEPKLRAAQEPEDRERITRRAKSQDMHEVCFSVRLEQAQREIFFMYTMTKRLITQTHSNRLIC